MDVVLFEEHRDIGSPQHCAGHISTRGLRALGIEMPQRLLTGAYRGAILHSPSGKRLIFDAGRTVSVSIDRRGFERHLADLSEGAGTALALGSRVRGLRPLGGSLEVRPSSPGPAAVNCRMALDAEGYPPKLLGEIRAWSPRDYSALMGIGAEVEEVDEVREGFVELYFGRDIAPGFFAWLIPLKGGGARIGLATERGNPRELLNRFIRDRLIPPGKLPSRPRMAEMEPHPIPIWRGNYKTYGERLLVVGDAASQVKPTTGGGLFLGMSCSSMAVGTARRALSTGDYGEGALSRYERLWRRAFSLELKLMGALRRIASGLGDRGVDILFEELSGSALIDRMNRDPEMDFQGKAIFRALLDPISSISAARIFFKLFSKGFLRRDLKPG
jgi:flavin-dependent dehydrogenase